MPRSPASPESSSEHPEVARLIARGAAEHPGIAEPPALRTLLAACVTRCAGDIEARGADLYLATACVAGDPAAIRLLDGCLPSVIRPAIAWIGVPVGEFDEIVQRVRVALLVHDETGRCGLAGYSGRGERLDLAKHPPSTECNAS